jgi:hypothetical protein
MGDVQGVNAMSRWFLAFAAAAVIGTAAMPNKAEAQVYVYEGARYCFYPDGWHGPGWYRCGYRWRSGFGWGGAYDWGVGFGWRHHGWEKRRHVHEGRRFRGQTQQSGQPVIRGGATVQQPTTGRGTISRGSSPEIRSGTTGVGVSRGGSDMRGGQGGMSVAPSGGSPGQGGAATGGGMGGGNVGGGAAGGGSSGGGGQQKR